jgi:hypothetical protein
MSTDTICLSPSAGDTTTKSDERPKAPAAAAPASIGGMLWFAGWLFTIGFVQLVWWKALLALIAWPYFLGVALRV